MASAQLTDAPAPVDHPTHPDAKVRIVPALINAMPVYVECPAFCSVDHVADNQRHLVDVTHAGQATDLYSPDIESGKYLMLFARLGTDPYSPKPERRVPFVAIDDGGPNDAQLTPAQAEEFADSLMAFALQVRAMARLAASQAVA